MPKRPIRSPAITLVCALIGGAALIATDIGTAVDGNWAPIRSDIRITLATGVVLAVIWLVLNAQTEAHNVSRARLDGHEARMNRYADRLEDLERTAPLPKLRVGAIVATAPVPAPVDPEVVSILGRLQHRVSDH